MEKQEYLKKIKAVDFEDVQVVSNGEFYVEGKESEVIEKLMSITAKVYKCENKA